MTSESDFPFLENEQDSPLSPNLPLLTCLIPSRGIGRQSIQLIIPYIYNQEVL